MRALHVTPERAEKAFLEWKRAKEEQKTKGQDGTARPGKLPPKHAAADAEAKKEDAEKVR